MKKVKIIVESLSRYFTAARWMVYLLTTLFFVIIGVICVSLPSVLKGGDIDYSSDALYFGRIVMIVVGSILLLLALFMIIKIIRYMKLIKAFLMMKSAVLNENRIKADDCKYLLSFCYFGKKSKKHYGFWVFLSFYFVIDDKFIDYAVENKIITASRANQKVSRMNIRNLPEKLANAFNAELIASQKTGSASKTHLEQNVKTSDAKNASAKAMASIMPISAGAGAENDSSQEHKNFLPTDLGGNISNGMTNLGQPKSFDYSMLKKAKTLKEWLESNPQYSKALISNIIMQMQKDLTSKKQTVMKTKDQIKSAKDCAGIIDSFTGKESKPMHHEHTTSILGFIIFIFGIIVTVFGAIARTVLKSHDSWNFYAMIIGVCLIVIFFILLIVKGVFFKSGKDISADFDDTIKRINGNEVITLGDVYHERYLKHIANPNLDYGLSGNGIAINIKDREQIKMIVDSYNDNRQLTVNNNDEEDEVEEN